MDDDLVHVLRYINRKPLQANNALTRVYLEAGVRLLEGHLFVESAGNDRLESRTFRWLSRGKVIAEVANGPECSLKGNDGTFRDRWDPFSDYLGDLILYSLRDCQWDARTDLAK
ncbi:MAG: hypothetical protein ACRDTC_19230 [Pseudonocardiaceae bacterium]